VPSAAYTTTILDAKVDLVRKVFDINVFGVLSKTQQFVPLLLQAKGTIVNIGSMTGRIQALTRAHTAHQKRLFK
jgi:1-acylglycerone phosphate reductase